TEPPTRDNNDENNKYTESRSSQPMDSSRESKEESNESDSDNQTWRNRTGVEENLGKVGDEAGNKLQTARKKDGFEQNIRQRIKFDPQTDLTLLGFILILPRKTKCPDVKVLLDETEEGIIIVEGRPNEVINIQEMIEETLRGSETSSMQHKLWRKTINVKAKEQGAYVAESTTEVAPYSIYKKQNVGPKSDQKLTETSTLKSEGDDGKQNKDDKIKCNRDGGDKTGSTGKQLSDFENKGNRDKGVKTGSIGKQLSDFENKGHSLNDKTEMQQSEENYPGNRVLKLYPDLINLPNNEADPTADCKSSMKTGLFSKPDTAKGWPGAQGASGATGHTDLSVVSTGEKRIVGKMKYPGYADKESRPSGTQNETDVALVNLTRGSIGDITNGEISFSNPTDFTREYTKAYDRDHRKTGDYEDTDMKGRSSRTYTETDVYKFSTRLHNSQMSTGKNVSINREGCISQQANLARDSPEACSGSDRKTKKSHHVVLPKESVGEYARSFSSLKAGTKTGRDTGLFHDQTRTEPPTRDNNDENNKYTESRNSQPMDSSRESKEESNESDSDNQTWRNRTGVEENLGKVGDEAGNKLQTARKKDGFEQNIRQRIKFDPQTDLTLLGFILILPRKTKCPDVKVLLDETEEGIIIVEGRPNEVINIQEMIEETLRGSETSSMQHKLWRKTINVKAKEQGAYVAESTTEVAPYSIYKKQNVGPKSDQKLTETSTLKSEGDDGKQNKDEKIKCKTDRQPFNAGKTFPTKDGKQSKITMENSVIFGSDKTGSTGKQLSDVEKKGNRDGGDKTGSTGKQLSDFENKGNRDKGVKTGSIGKQLSDFENKGHSLNDKTEMQQSEENYPGNRVLKLYPDLINLPNNEADPTADCKSSMKTGLFSKPDTAKGWPGAQGASGATGHTDLSVVSAGEKRIVGKIKYPGYADKESRPSGTHNETDVALVNLTRGSIGDITNGEISFSNPTDFTREYTKAYDRDHRKTGDYEDTDMKGRSSRTYTETDVYKFSTRLHNSQMSTGKNVSINREGCISQQANLARDSPEACSGSDRKTKKSHHVVLPKESVG
ncbi:hypothetical protein RRG08_042089, partial [Elysia crispata]